VLVFMITKIQFLLVNLLKLKKLWKLLLFLKFPSYLCAINMRENILYKATELFLNLGFKSVTMDDIAKEMGISKKTIYQHFKTKIELVEATAFGLFELISGGIDQICALNKNPIDEIYSIKQFVMQHLKDEKSSPQYQLQKYYPKIFKSLKEKQFGVMQNCVGNNLIKGIALNLYRKNININFINRIYFSGIMNIKNRDLFPENQFSMSELMENFIEYHLRGICTEKGLNYLQNDIAQHKI